MKSFTKRLSDKNGKTGKNGKKRIAALYCAAILILIVSTTLGIILGSANIGFAELFDVVTGADKGGVAARIFLYVRMPRVCASLLCGAALAVSGAVIQSVLANRLASPSIIGVNSGAGLAVTVCAALGIYGGWQLSVFSFAGALAAVLLVSVSAKKWGASRGTVILIGVALNSLLGAISDTVITLDSDAGVISNDFKVGDFSFVTYSKLAPAAIIIIFTLLVLFTLSNELDVLTLGDETAKSLGLNVGRARVMFLIFAALLASSAVSLAGLVSFVGLLVPHAVRGLMMGKSGRHLLPLCALFGAGFVTLCDTVARTVFSPYEIPVGIIMAFLGAPFFVFILIKGKGGHSRDKA